MTWAGKNLTLDIPMFEVQSIKSRNLYDLGRLPKSRFDSSQSLQLSNNLKVLGVELKLHSPVFMRRV